MPSLFLAGIAPCSAGTRRLLRKHLLLLQLRWCLSTWNRWEWICKFSFPCETPETGRTFFFLTLPGVLYCWTFWRTDTGLCVLNCLVWATTHVSKTGWVHQVLTNSCRAPFKNACTPKIEGKFVFNVYCHIKSNLQELYELSNAEYYKYLLQTLPSVNCKWNKLEIKTPVPRAFLRAILGPVTSFCMFQNASKSLKWVGWMNWAWCLEMKYSFFLYPSVRWSLPKWWDMWVQVLWNTCTARMAVSTFWSWIPACKWSTPAQRW